MAHELDLSDCQIAPRLAIEDLISGFLDAGNYEDVCLAILAHPASVQFDQRTLLRLWAIGNGHQETSHVDRKMIGALAEYVAVAEGLVWSH